MMRGLEICAKGGQVEPGLGWIMPIYISNQACKPAAEVLVHNSFMISDLFFS